ncbi:MAG: D-aminoacyl-tRNA deacylase [Chlamydiae bacterium]|nr:D-aminoacyl-tRNA deacylase [Chlamydiota bacterium]
MRILIQRVTQASVTIHHKLHAEIGPGLLVFLGIHKEDQLHQASWLAEKCTHLRLFNDPQDKMNLSIRDTSGEILIVSQFTLYGTCLKGRRPEFTQSARGDQALELYEGFISEIKKLHPKVKTGQFGADMKVQLTNDGPVTFLIEK